MIKIGDNKYVDNRNLDRFDIVSSLIETYENGSKSDFDDYVKLLKTKHSLEKVTIYEKSDTLKYIVDSGSFDIIEADVYVPVGHDEDHANSSGAASLCTPKDSKIEIPWHFIACETVKAAAEHIKHSLDRAAREEAACKCKRLKIEKTLIDNDIKYDLNMAKVYSDVIDRNR